MRLLKFIRKHKVFVLFWITIVIGAICDSIASFFGRCKADDAIQQLVKNND